MGFFVLYWCGGENMETIIKKENGLYNVYTYYDFLKPRPVCLSFKTHEAAKQYAAEKLTLAKQGKMH